MYAHFCISNKSNLGEDFTRYHPASTARLLQVYTWLAGRPAAAGDRQGDSFGHCLATMKRTHSGPKKIAPPVDNLKMVTPYPKARATMNETTLSTLVPLGTPIVMHLYTG